MSALAYNRGGGDKHGEEGKEEKPNKGRSRNKFLGVRQRPSGRWVAEIKGTTQKIRMWLGTFQTAEEAARAYDEAACLLRGSNTRTNFATKVSSDSPLAKRIRNLLSKRSVQNKKMLQGKAHDTSTFNTIQQKQRRGVVPDRSQSPQYLSWGSSTLFHETQLGPVKVYESDRILKAEKQISASFSTVNDTLLILLSCK